MGTKQNPNPNDCYEKAMPHEPMFVLLARDASAPAFIREWAEYRRLQINESTRPIADMAQVNEALQCADDMEKWRKENDGAWRALPLFEDKQIAYAENRKVVTEANRKIEDKLSADTSDFPEEYYKKRNQQPSPDRLD